MDFFDLIDERSSIRSFQQREVSDNKLEKLLAAATRAPSAGNLQAYRIYVVESNDKQQALASASHDQQFIEQAPLVLVFLQDSEQSKRKYGTRGEKLFSIQDATIAAAYLQLAATEMGMGTCWVGSFDEGKVQEILGVENRPICIMPLGYTRTNGGTKSRRPLEEIVIYEENK